MVPTLLGPDGLPLSSDQRFALIRGRADDRLGPDDRRPLLRTLLGDLASTAEVAREVMAASMARRFREAQLSLETPIGFTKRGRPVFPIAGAAERLFFIQNSAQATTAAPVKQPTGTAIRTMQQIEAPSTTRLTIVEWGISYDGTDSTKVPIQTELFTTTVAATMSTAAVAADVTLFNAPADEVSLITYGGTTHTGFATAAVTEGTVANYRALDIQQLNNVVAYVKQNPLGREPVCPVSKLIRVRVTAGTTVNAYIYVIWAE